MDRSPGGVNSAALTIFAVLPTGHRIFVVAAGGRRHDGLHFQAEPAAVVTNMPILTPRAERTAVSAANRLSAATADEDGSVPFTPA